MLDTTPEHPYAAGIIRFTETGPEWYFNSSHITRGFDTSIQPEILSNGRLHVKMITSMPVEYATASPDETLAERGIMTGISSGVGDSNIGISVPGLRDASGLLRRRLRLDQPTEYAMVAGEFSNAWLFVKRVPPINIQGACSCQ